MEVDSLFTTTFDETWSGSPLHQAVLMGDESICHLLLLLGENSNVQDNMGRSPLHYAAWGVLGSEKIVQLLLENGADPDIRDEKNMTPLFCHVARNRLTSAGILLEAGADVNFQSFDGSSPLHVAARGNLEQMAVLLMAYGANHKLRDVSGQIAFEK